MRFHRAAFFGLLFGGVLSAAFSGVPVSARTPLEVGGWVPYWRMATGTADVLPNIKTLTSVMPFGYTMKSDGTIYDAMNYASSTSLQELVKTAKKNKVRVVPTIMWSNGDAIHAVLSDTARRIALEDAIVKLVKENGFDGIDIDFEGKKAETKPYFATFLKGLYQRMGNKWVYCAIEARTPVSSRYDSTPPPDATVYANDFVAINKYCDRVEIMAYDQGTIDLKLNKAANSAPYIPISDIAWVKKVVNETAKTISKKKIVIGVATYGYEYEVTPLSESGYRYELQWAFNPRYAVELAAAYGITPKRNSAGEMSFTYVPTTTPSTAADTTTGNITIASTSYSDGTTATPLSFAGHMNILWWSDAQAIASKMKLARELDVRGIAIFKLDGGEDPAMWKTVAANK